MPILYSDSIPQRRALLVDEILRNITCTLDASSLACFARTCRAFSEPALDALWMSLDSFLPLVSILPEDAVHLKIDAEHALYEAKRRALKARLAQSASDGKSSDVLQREDAFRFASRYYKCYNLKRSITTADWDKVLSYTRRVRHIRPQPKRQRFGIILPEMLSKLAPPPQYQCQLFPRLESVYWMDSNSSAFPLLLNLAGPSLLSLDVPDFHFAEPTFVLGGHSNTNTFDIAKLGAYYPSLQHFRIHPGGTSPFYVQPLTKALRSMNKLVSLELDLVNMSVLQTISSMPSLESATLHLYPHSFNGAPLQLTNSSFPKLKKLAIRHHTQGYEQIGRLLDIMAGSASITSLSVTFTYAGPEGLAEVIKETCAHFGASYALESLEIKEYSPWRHEERRHHKVVRETIEPALRLSILRRLVLDTPRSSALNRGILESIAASCPYLEVLGINGILKYGVRNVSPRRQTNDYSYSADEELDEVESLVGTF